MRLLDVAGAVDLAPREVADHLARDGLVLVREGSVEAVRSALKGWTAPVRHPDDREAGVTHISPHGQGAARAGGAGMTRRRLPPHTDRSLQPEPPSVLAAVMVVPAVSGGDALLTDGAAVLEVMQRRTPPDATDRLRLRTTNGTLVPVFTRRSGLVAIRFRDDELAAPSSEGEFGDVLALRKAISRVTRSVPLQTGDGYILHNQRYLHGRSSFRGERTLARMLATVTADPFAWLNEGFRCANA